MIKVHKFGEAFGMPDVSPFVVKIETYLRMTKQPYEPVIADLRRAPRRQLPCIEIDGKVIPDSSGIIEHLENARAEKLDRGLDDRERAIALAFKSMLEEHFYFAGLYMRWATDDGWAALEPTFRTMLARMRIPALVRGLIAKQARKGTIARTTMQGIGRKPRAEVVATAAAILDALSTYLGDRPFVCGDAPTTFDATAYAFITGALCPAFDNEIRKHALTKPNLVAYAARMNDAFWKA